MTTQWGTLTIGSTPVQISATQLRCCKLSFQVAPGDSGADAGHEYAGDLSGPFKQYQ